MECTIAMPTVRFRKTVKSIRWAKQQDLVVFGVQNQKFRQTIACRCILNVHQLYFFDVSWFLATNLLSYLASLSLSTPKLVKPRLKIDSFKIQILLSFNYLYKKTFKIPWFRLKFQYTVKISVIMFKKPKCRLDFLIMIRIKGKH